MASSTLTFFAQEFAHFVGNGADLSHGVAKILFGAAKRLRPIANFVWLIRIDSASVLSGPNAGVVGHACLHSQDVTLTPLYNGMQSVNNRSGRRRREDADKGRRVYSLCHSSGS